MLSAVGNLNATVLDSTISLTWEAPFFLDIFSIDPDITYRVDVINSTSSQVIHSQGGITITQYNYTTSLSLERRACDVFKFIIIPVNIVGNGNESSISQGYGEYWGGGGGGGGGVLHVMCSPILISICII